MYPLVESYLWDPFNTPNWMYLCDIMRTTSRGQTTSGSPAADTAGDVVIPKEKPRPPCEAVYKSTIETRISSDTGGFKLNSAMSVRNS